MIALLQRVLRAQVNVSGKTVGSIGPGLLVLVAVQPADDEAGAQRHSAGWCNTESLPMRTAR